MGMLVESLIVTASIRYLEMCTGNYKRKKIKNSIKITYNVKNNL